MANDHRIIVTGGDSRTKCLTVLLGKIIFSGYENTRAGIELLKIRAPLLGQAVRDNKHRLVRKAQPPQLHCRRCHRPCLACADAVRQKRVAAVQDAGDRVALVLAHFNIGVHAWESEIIPVKRARPRVVEVFVIVIHQPCAPVRITVYPILKCLPQCVLLITRLDRLLRVGDALLLTVYDLDVENLHIAQIKRKLQQLIATDTRGAVFRIGKGVAVIVSRLVSDMPAFYGVRIGNLDLISRVKRRAQHFPHKLCDIFGRYPCSAEPDTDFRSGKRCRHHAFQHPYINRKRRVLLRVLLCRFQFLTDVAGQVFVRRLPLAA